MSRINKLLEDWVSKGLMTREQADKISVYEESKSSSSWAFYGFVLLGVIIIGVGIISLIASNWKKISDTLKLILDFLLLFSLAWGALLAWQRKKALLFEVLLVLFMILCLASIGLISQIYHTGGKFYQALFLWSLITSGTVAASKGYLVPFFWALGFLSSFTFLLIESPVLQPLFRGSENAVFMTGPLLIGVMAILCRSLNRGGRQVEAFRAVSILGGMISLVLGEIPFWRHNFIEYRLLAFLPGYLLGLALFFGVWMNLNYKKMQKTLLGIALGLYLIFFHFSLFEIRPGLLYAAFSIAIFGSISLFFASLKQRKLFQLFLVVLGLRFLVLYFQAFGGLATTGIGLIISGVLIIAMVVAWNKYRRGITIWAEGWVE